MFVTDGGPVQRCAQCHPAACPWRPRLRPRPLCLLDERQSFRATRNRTGLLRQLVSASNPALSSRCTGRITKRPSNRGLLMAFRCIPGQQSMACGTHGCSNTSDSPLRSCVSRDWSRPLAHDGGGAAPFAPLHRWVQMVRELRNRAYADCAISHCRVVRHGCRRGQDQVKQSQDCWQRWRPDDGGWSGSRGRSIIPSREGAYVARNDGGGPGTLQHNYSADRSVADETPAEAA